MLGISLRNKIRNEEIRRRTKVVDIMKRISESKWQWVGHVARQNHDSWTARITHWRTKRSVGRTQKRWLDDIKPIAGKRRSQTAQDRNAGKRMKEVYVQECTKKD